MRPDSRGFQLVELLVVSAAFLLVAGLAFPPLLRASSVLRLRLAAGEVVGILREARAQAIRRDRNVAVKFRLTPDGRTTFTLYRDGDGDGVRSRDIERGVDPPLGRPRYVDHLGRAIHLGFPPGLRPRDPSGHGHLGRLDDPVRFNRSDLASFGPLGTSTPGSIYLTDGRNHLVVVRVLGRTGKVKILVYDAAEERWE